MIKILQFLIFTGFSTGLYAQNFTGQWKGEFVDKSSAFVGWGGDRCEYILELTTTGSRVTGYSYTYFSEGGKRYYTICKLSGTFNKATKYIEVKETERTKTNVPVNIRNCFQIHRLTYSQDSTEQILEGTWVPVPNQEGDCGFGTTMLSRRVLQKNPVYYNNTITKNKPKTTAPVVKAKPKTASPPVVKANPVQPVKKPVIKTETAKKAPATGLKTQPEKKNTTETVVTDNAKTEKPGNIIADPKPQKSIPAERKISDKRYEKRNTDVIKTIEIDNPGFTVALYDNGEIDGDSISLFFNGSLLLSHKRLSDKPITLKLNVDELRDINELIMYAENLGTIPPNTALMVVNDGDNRYEVRISSDLQKSGVIRFVHKPKIKQ
ncbi:MAG: hypothetical protein IPL50_09270 [Chitinophagaceae bacterium]|nr:hypothetical protein [Chitinophagaceae bacterium]